MPNADPTEHRRMTMLQGDALDLAPDPVLQAIAVDAVKATGAAWAGLKMLVRTPVIFRAYHNPPHDLVNVFAFEAAGSLSQQVVTTGEPISVDDADRAGRSRLHCRAHLVVPVAIDGVRVGALCVLDGEPHVFDD